MEEIKEENHNDDNFGSEIQSDKSPNSGNYMDNKRDSKKRFSKLHKITEIISLQNPFDAQVQYYCKKYGFNEKELRAIKKSFDQIAEKGLMTMEQFKESLGLIGLNEDFVRKIWYVISGGGPESQASFEDFLKYLKVLMNGTQYEKLLYSIQTLVRDIWLV
ncbi:hypothetical protein PPERSA_00322 [Pseudocohnilembus persalinus]|uniref:EF-hand domain-containing protein n=1 Tax=Pseudocohnilembus persalinus TaxID=266149 RepID=A0A0V0QHB4_PSEPJ|nr:hypothetical protein PPERSA_00322 [Pseudocohnilembus persalinus]|eukprot:KRX01615.1 hypothetical protein PPERSA_00322 [Pseudocohnilembus persalinus]